MADSKEESKPTVAQRLAAEAIGTFAITATAIAVDVLLYSGEPVDYVSRWLARGFVAAVVVYVFSEISGAHANPAVTLGFWLRRVFSGRLAGAYVLAQFAGSFAAAALLLGLFGQSLASGVSHPGPHFSAPIAAVCELVLTAGLMLVILITAREQAVVGKQAALAVGFTIAACGFAAGPISGASMNPARTIAPAILAGMFSLIWIYAIAPCAGAALAVAVHAFLCGPPTHAEKKAAKGR